MRRRSFLGLMGLGAAAPVLANVAPAAPPPAPLPVPPPVTPRVIGAKDILTDTLSWDDIVSNSITADKLVISPTPDWMAPHDR